MKTSSFSNRSQRTVARLHGRCPAAVVVVVVTLLGGCGGDGADGSCIDETAAATDSFPDSAVRRAQLRLERRTTQQTDGSLAEQLLAQMSLVDLTKVDVTSRPPEPCCGLRSCFLLTGSPTTSCRKGFKPPCLPEPLDADKVTVTGLVGGSVTLDSAGGGRFTKTGLKSPLFTDNPITVKVQAKSSSSSFPSYDQKLAAPAQLELTSPDPKAKQLSAGTTDLDVAWNAGDGDWVELSVSSNAKGATDRVVCVVEDDGCATMPIGAIEAIKLDMKPTDKIELTVTRVKSTTRTLDAKTGAQIKAQSRVELLLDQ